MSDPRPVRVRVTGPPRRVHAPRARTGDIDDQTALGDVYLGSLLREQLTLAGRILGLLAVTVGSLPLLFHLFPRLAGTPRIVVHARSVFGDLRLRSLAPGESASRWRAMVERLAARHLPPPR